MSQRRLKYSKSWLLLPIGLLVLWVRSRLTSSNPENEIKKALRGTRWAPLTSFVIAQAKHETEGFKSNIFRGANNLFGMGVPGSRQSLRNGVFVAADGRKYSKFATVGDSARDFVLYLENQNFPVVRDSFEYVAALKNRRYFEDNFNNYLRGLQSWL